MVIQFCPSTYGDPVLTQEGQILWARLQTFATNLCMASLRLHSDLVIDVHTDYLLAGADIITTNNFVCVEHQLAREGLQSELISMTQAAASCATQAVARAQSQLPAGSAREFGVAGALPPLQVCYFPPELSTDAMVTQYSTIARAFSSSVDVLLGETLASAAEACAAASAAASTGVPTWVSLTLHDDLSSTLRGGDSLVSTVDQLLALKLPKLEGILLNCCSTECIDAAMPKLASATSGTGLALGAYGNIFEGTTSQWLETATHGPRPYPWAGRCACPMPMERGEYEQNIEESALTGEGVMTSAAYTTHALRWRESGASLIGGCCGTTPEHIRTLAQALATPTAGI